jgi:hypothetical protein
MLVIGLFGAPDIIVDRLTQATTHSPSEDHAESILRCCMPPTSRICEDRGLADLAKGHLTMLAENGQRVKKSANYSEQNG